MHPAGCQRRGRVLNHSNQWEMLQKLHRKPRGRWKMQISWAQLSTKFDGICRPLVANANCLLFKATESWRRNRSQDQGETKKPIKIELTNKRQRNTRSSGWGPQMTNSRSSVDEFVSENLRHVGVVCCFVFCLRKLTVWASEKLWRWPYADWAYPLWSPTFTSSQINRRIHFFCKSL